MFRMTEIQIKEQEAREAARNGAAILDERVPGWASKIDLDELRLSSCTQCVLGQLCETITGSVVRASFSNSPYSSAYKRLFQEDPGYSEASIRKGFMPLATPSRLASRTYDHELVFPHEVADAYKAALEDEWAHQVNQRL